MSIGRPDDGTAAHPLPAAKDVTETPGEMMANTVGQVSAVIEAMTLLRDSSEAAKETLGQEQDFANLPSSQRDWQRLVAGDKELVGRLTEYLLELSNGLTADERAMVAAHFKEQPATSDAPAPT
jgi:hypothetical protein